MQFLNLKSVFIFIAIISLLPAFSHNKNPNTFILTLEDSTVSIYSKSRSNSAHSNFQILTDQSWEMRSHSKSAFQSVQIEEWEFYNPNQYPLEVKSHNTNPTSVQVIENGKSINWLGTETNFIVSLKNEPRFITVIKNYILFGIEHILIGFDHLLFVLGLLFIVKRKSILWTITAFTVAHNITLGLAVSGWLIHVSLGLSKIWVEAMIAGSILILSLEMRIGNKHSTQKAVGIAFTFGLLHGLGFAGVLQELGLPDTAFWHALVSFNIGVELGQLLFIAILVLLFQFIKKAVSFEKLTAVLSILVGGLAALWCIERTLLLANLI